MQAPIFLHIARLIAIVIGCTCFVYIFLIDLRFGIALFVAMWMNNATQALSIAINTYSEEE